MTYGFCPESWPAFQAELRKRGVAVADIEKVDAVTLRSGRVESWRQRQVEAAALGEMD